ncbi:hypothetical protein [Niveibacterium sp. COAC-50]|uniref:hypothetical protein n=1 Tax=Niveibacterium sp. COAC-50 TaxID=2729384 RepID=UPI0015538E5F|nr:hypothetical protein [Niveibacterium sp. COAC-50]
MYAAETQPNGRRDAALALHALDAPSRERVLTRLDESTCRELRDLLEELTVLGIPRTLAQDALARARATQSTTSLAPDALLAARALDGLASSTVAAILRAAKGPLHDACREQMTPERFAEVEAALAAAPALSPHAAQRLLAHFAEQLRSQPAPVEAVERTRAKRDWLATIRNGLRWSR